MVSKTPEQGRHGGSGIPAPSFLCLAAAPLFHYNQGRSKVLSNASIWNSIKKSQKLTLIAGPCVIESEAVCRRIAGSLRETCRRLGVHYIFKASFDKANRSSGRTFRGPGLEAGLEALAKIRREFQVPVLTDVHTEDQVVLAAAVVDVLQIPAFLCRQTDLIAAAARSGKIVNLKKGQFLSPLEMGQVVQKAVEAGGRKLLVTERGTTFGYHNLVSDMRSIPILRTYGYPVIFDATHSVQLPGAGGDRSGGQREMAPVLARCAVAAGTDGLFIETHPNPDKALSDGPNMIRLDNMAPLLAGLVKLRALANRWPKLK
jgi:2-dehydro-3-deoxyphosphooctonate aldolase (KDO 8-P synthase)